MNALAWGGCAGRAARWSEAERVILLSQDQDIEGAWAMHAFDPVQLDV